MKNYKIYFCLIIVFLVFLLFPFKNSFAKYAFEEAILVANIDIDRTKPKVEISYSQENFTKEKVVVTITANEEIKEVEGWKLLEDKKTLTKEYEENTVEEMEIQDISGNKINITININQIDREAPTIEIANIKNSNENYSQYANKEKTITVELTIRDNNSISDLLKESDIKIIIGNKEIIPKEKKLVYEKNEAKEKSAKLTLLGIEEEGNLKIEILQNVIKDDAGNSNIGVQKDTKIIIDNTKPETTFKENKIEEGKIEGIITADEEICKLKGWKIEDGNVEEDFLQARAFVYTNWGEDSKAICNDSNKIYIYGWNPSNLNWEYLNEENTIKLNNENYFQLGGAGVNGEGETDLAGNGMISKELMEEYRYGISAIQLKLKSYENNSIIYQVYIDSVGWLKPAKNEEIACYEKTKPISAIRVALVPNSEVDSVYDSWNKDTGKIL